MTPKALLIGSIGVVVETSELQRRAFNAAFQDAGLNWHWTPQVYRMLLKHSGGANRIADYARARGEDVDAAPIHAAKVSHYAALMAEEGLRLRPGLRKTLDVMANHGLPVAWVTDTGKPQLQAILDALGDQLHADDFAFLGPEHGFAARKPDPAPYLAALDALGLDASDAVAVEDTGVCARSAIAAGVLTYGYPNTYADVFDFPAEAQMVETLAPDVLGLQPAPAQMA